MMYGTLAFGCDDCDMKMVDATLKPLRMNKAHDKRELDALQIKSLDAIEQGNKADDDTTNAQSKSDSQLRSIGSDSEEGSENGSEGEANMSNIRPYQ